MNKVGTLLLYLIICHMQGGEGRYFSFFPSIFLCTSVPVHRGYSNTNYSSTHVQCIIPNTVPILIPKTHPPTVYRNLRVSIENVNFVEKQIGRLQVPPPLLTTFCGTLIYIHTVSLEYGNPHICTCSITKL